MKQPIKNSNVEYNLRWWASGIQWGLFAAPFVIFNIVAEDALDHMSSDYEYLEAIAGCALLLISLSIVGFVPSIARACARDRSKYRQTMKASVNAAVIIFFALLFALGMYAWSYFDS